MLARALEFAKDESGATAIEYGLIAALMGIGLIVAFTVFGSSLTGLFGVVNTKAGGAMDGATG